MPIDRALLEAALSRFQAAIGYDAIAIDHQGDWSTAPAAALNAARQKRASAIRGEAHIRPIYDYCTAELVARGFRQSSVFPQPGAGRRARTKVHGGFFEKEVDAGVSLEHTGPLLIVSGKAMLTASRNLKNRIEEAIADAANLHTRYPMLCFGFVMVVPSRMETEKDVSGKRQWVNELVVGADGKSTPLGENLLRYLEQLQPRVDITETLGRYEAVALAAVDFDRSPPRLCPDFPPTKSPIRIEGFFDLLHQRFIERNRFISEVLE